MKKLAKGLWDKYKAWPWWGKVLGCFILVGILALLILSVIPAPTLNKAVNDIDEFHDNVHEADMSETQEEEEELRKVVIKNKLEIARKLNTAEVVDAETMEQRTELTNAQTMEDLDKLQQKWGL